jgi:hypothetical protein
MPPKKESKEVYSGTPMYDANRRYAGLDASSVVGYTPSGNTYYHTSDGTIVHNNNKKKGGQSRSKKYGRRKSMRRNKSVCTKRR